MAETTNDSASVPPTEGARTTEKAKERCPEKSVVRGWICSRPAGHLGPHAMTVERCPDVLAEEARCDTCRVIVANPTTGRIAGNCAFCPDGRMVATKGAWSMPGHPAAPTPSAATETPDARLRASRRMPVLVDVIAEALPRSTTRDEVVAAWAALEELGILAVDLAALSSPTTEGRDDG